MNYILLRRGLVFAVSVFFALTANAGPWLRLGVMGDSLSDEYFEDPTRAYAKNWLQQLADNRAVDPGPTAGEAGQLQGTWGSPRATGYACNWAAAWATSRSLLDDGQAAGLVSQVVTDGIDCAVLAIGSNDFNPYTSAYDGIYNGAWSAARILAQERKTLANIKTAIVTVRRTGVPLILVDILDSGSTPAVATSLYFPDAAKRQRVTGVIGDLNRRLRQLAQTYQIPMVDWFGLEQRLGGPPTNRVPVLLLGNTPIMLQQADPGPGPDANPMAGCVADGFHPHTTIQGVLANTIIAALDNSYGADLPFFSEEEILQHAGLPYGGVDTLFDRIGAYTNYVFLPVPSGPIGAFQFVFPATNAVPNPSTNWRLRLEIRTKVNAQTALPNLTATAQLSLPDGDTLVFPEVPARYSVSTGYTLTFKRGKTIPTSPATDRQTVLIIRNLIFSGSAGNWQPHGGTITYRRGVERQSGVVE